MGKPPAVIIVVRHGARLDAADPQWHLTSPTPYDPPLTYGGWGQSKSLGMRIANILRSRENDEEILNATTESLAGKDRGKRRHKIVIHSSPFLRCVQTSIAISAGLAQNGSHGNPKHSNTSPQISRPMHSSPRIRPTATGSPALLPIPEPSVPWGKERSPERGATIKRSALRVDSFLGEWLSPDYFDLITPPPSSAAMVAAAKADLLRREDYASLLLTKDNKANQPFPGGWGCSFVAEKEDENDKKKEDGAFSDISSLALSLPKRERTSSLSSSGSHGNRHRGTTHHVQPPGSQGAHGVYQPPVPSYAISSSDPIPPGYVSHARDACVEVDYQWDSMREPHNLGNGGEYGEEWSSMHKRFRAGLQNLVEWYQKSDESSKLITRNRSNSLRTFSPEEEAAGENTDLVVILVTHGAGCNALIGALTNQPVLLDVGMASLTMAIRKPDQISTSTTSSSDNPDPHPLATSKKLSISDQYEVRLVANNEHLRNSASSTPSSSRAPSVTGFSNIRDRFTNTGSIDMVNYNRSRSQNSCLGSIRRTASVTSSHMARSQAPARFNSAGLWTAPRYREETESEDEMILNFENDGSSAQKKTSSEKEPIVTISRAPEITSQNTHSTNETPLGLWGSSQAPCLAEKPPEVGQKRRWTIHDRESIVGLGRTAA
ncbi:hypothetical protein K3495_g4059 [Podosphaera aphanis]|nr:hypothetical protein K3495_g4059 [Podosphaera aphanis]